MIERKPEGLSPALKLASLAGKMLPDRVVTYLYRLGPFSRLLRSLLSRAAPVGMVEVEIAGGPLAGMRMILDLQFEKDIWLGAYETNTLAAIAALGWPGMVAYDIGANLGYVSLALAKVCGPTGHVVAFEPLPHNVERMHKNLELNDLPCTVSVEPRAVGHETGVASFLIHRSHGMGKLAGSHGRAAEYHSPVSVEVVALDDYVRSTGVPEPDLIKIDIEGGEVGALLGMKRVLQEAKPILLVELHGEEAAKGCWDALKEADYRVSRMSPSREPVQSPADLGWKAHILAMPARHSVPARDRGSIREG